MTRHDVSKDFNDIFIFDGNDKNLKNGKREMYPIVSGRNIKSISTSKAHLSSIAKKLNVDTQKIIYRYKLLAANNIIMPNMPLTNEAVELMAELFKYNPETESVVDALKDIVVHKPELIEKVKASYANTFAQKPYEYKIAENNEQNDKQNVFDKTEKAIKEMRLSISDLKNTLDLMLGQQQNMMFKVNSIKLTEESIQQSIDKMQGMLNKMRDVEASSFDYIARTCFAARDIRNMCENISKSHVEKKHGLGSL